MVGIDAKIVQRKYLEEETGILLSDCIECASPIEKNQDYIAINISQEKVYEYTNRAFSYLFENWDLVRKYRSSIMVITKLREAFPDTDWVIVMNC